jgi:hypothetical protein
MDYMKKLLYNVQNVKVKERYKMTPKWQRLVMLLMVLSITAVLITSCSEFALLASGSSLAISQNTYAKVYNGVDVLTIMNTEKSMKRHVYDNAKKAWAETKQGKKYIYDQSIELFKNK